METVSLESNKIRTVFLESDKKMPEVIKGWEQMCKQKVNLKGKLKDFAIEGPGYQELSVQHV